jgi:ribosomal protein L11 methyltransferase
MTVKADNEKWYAVDVQAPAAAGEAVESAFNILEAMGTEIDTLRKTPDQFITITGYFNELPETELVRKYINESLQIYGIPDTAIRSVANREVENEDWLAEWKRHWKPTAVGKFIIAPPWSDVVPDDRIVIRIEPNMAFGTGTHETTKLCLQAISRDYRTGQSFLDVGTGTGILAIAAAKLSDTASISAYETDADSVSIARENAELNGVGGSIDFTHGPIDSMTQKHDLVFANLTLDVIEPILPLLLEKTNQQLVMSGILAEQKELIGDQLTGLGFADPHIRTDGEWISISVHKD